MERNGENGLWQLKKPDSFQPGEEFFEIKKPFEYQPFDIEQIRKMKYNFKEINDEKRAKNLDLIRGKKNEEEEEKE